MNILTGIFWIIICILAIAATIGGVAVIAATTFFFVVPILRLILGGV